MQLAPGTLLGARFRLVRKLGAGSMGAVWAGDEVTTRRAVALKVLLPEVSMHAEICARFKREALLLSRIRSKHAPRVLDFASDPVHGPLLVMELVRGRSLAEDLDRGTLSVEDAIEIGIEIARALEEIHRAGIVHRDVKPANVLLRDGRRRARVVLVDFGLGRLVEGLGPRPYREEGDSITAITQHDMAVGTIAYMAPEQIFDSSGVGAPADLYALGAILFRAVTGEHVFGDVQGTKLVYEKLTRDPRPLVMGRSDRVAEGFAAVVRRALLRLPDQRYQSAAEMRDALIDLGRGAGSVQRTRFVAGRTVPQAREGDTGALGGGAEERPSFTEELAHVPRAVLFRLSAVGAALALAALVAGTLLGSRLFAGTPVRPAPALEERASATVPRATCVRADDAMASRIEVSSSQSQGPMSPVAPGVDTREKSRAPAPRAATRAVFEEMKHRELLRAMARAVGVVASEVRDALPGAVAASD